MKTILEYTNIFENLNTLGKVNTKEEEYLRLALEWYMNTMSDGEMVTIYNLFNIIDDYRTALFEIQAMASVSIIDRALSLCNDKNDLENIDTSIFDYKKGERDLELMNMIDKKIEELNLQSV